jgi:hypothetical protein
METFTKLFGSLLIICGPGHLGPRGGGHHGRSRATGFVCST